MTVACPVPDLKDGCLYSIPGLLCETEFISQEQESHLIDVFRHQLVWPDRKGRLALHFGYTFDYKSMGIDETIPFISFPPWLENVLPADESRKPDQVCLQYYAPGIGIPPHCDTHSIYDQLYSLSLGSPVLMDFKRDQAHFEVDLLPRSMLQMTGDSRLHWTHGIKKRKRDVINGQERFRDDRWSITFRWLRHGECECGDLNTCDTAQRRLGGPQKTFRWQTEPEQTGGCAQGTTIASA